MPKRKPSWNELKKKCEFVDQAKVAERIKQELDIVDVMEDAGVDFVSKGQVVAKAKCFSHQESNPSLHVNRDKQLFNCFGAGCEAGGDVVSFWMQYYRDDFVGACMALLEKYGINYDDLVRDPTPDELERERLKAINFNVAKALNDQLNTSKMAQEWLAERGLDGAEAVLSRFLVGFSPTFRQMSKIVDRLNINERDVEILQLNYGELFENRIIYPIQDAHGDVLSFYGRVIGGDRTKYMGQRSENKHGVQHPLLSTDIPYGFSCARSGLAGGGALVLVEGMNDVLMAHKHGVINVAGMRGAAPTSRMYELLKTFNINNVVVCPDGDAAGFRTVDSIGKNRARHQSVKVMTLPEGMDPDQFIDKYGAEAFNSRVGDAVYPVELMIRSVATTLTEGSTSDKLDAMKHMSGHINSLSGFEREFAIQELSTMTDTDRSMLEELVASSGEAEFSDLGLESKLLITCMCDKNTAVHVLSVVKPEDFSSARYGRWAKAIRQMIADDIEVFSREMFVTYAVDKGLIKEDEVDMVPKESLGTISADYAAHRVLDMATRRRLNKAGSDFVNALRNAKKPVDESLNEHLKSVSISVCSNGHSSTAQDHIIQAMDVVAERMKNPGQIPGINIGPKWRRLMAQLMGFQPGHMLSIAGVSKAGKTTIAQNWCMEQLVNCGEPTLWVNLEMTTMDLTLRNLSILTGIPNTRLKVGNISKQERAALEDASAKYHGFPLYVSSMAGANAFDVVNTIRRHVYSHKVRLVFVDYLQLISPVERNGKMALWEAQNEVVASIRHAISSLQITGVVISQLNRGAMAEASASGQFVSGTIRLIQDSDAFMGLRRKSKQEMSENPHSNAALVVEFNRHGPQDTIIDLDHRHESMQIEEI